MSLLQNLKPINYTLPVGTESTLIKLITNIVANIIDINLYGCSSSETQEVVLDGKNSNTTTPLTSPYTLLATDEEIEPDNSSAIFTVKLPPAGSTDIPEGKIFWIIDYQESATSYPITLNDNGCTLNGKSGDRAISTDGGWIRLKYNGNDDYTYISG